MESKRAKPSENEIEMGEAREKIGPSKKDEIREKERERERGGRCFPPYN